MRYSIVAALAACALATSVAAQTDTVRPVRDTAKVTQTAGGDVVLREKPAPAPRIILEVVSMTTGEELSGVEVIDALTGREAVTTDSAKLVDIWSLIAPSPFARLMIRKAGYRPESLLVNLAQDTASRTISLVENPLGDTTKAIELPGMRSTASEVTFSASGFETRMAHSSYGRFVPPDSLRKYDNKTINEVFDAFKIVQPKRSTKIAPCKTLYYVDGVEYPAAGPPSDFPSQYEAIEYYPDGNYAPVQFRPTDRGAICAVYAFWMRGYK